MLSKNYINSERTPKLLKPRFFRVILMNPYNKFTCMSGKRACDQAMPMSQKQTNDGTIEHCVIDIAPFHFTVAITPPRHRFIIPLHHYSNCATVSMLSCYWSSAQHRFIVIALSHHRTIDEKPRWCHKQIVD